MQTASQKFGVASLLYLLNIFLILLYEVVHLGMAAGSATEEGPASPLSCNQTCDQAEEGIDAFCNNRNLTEVPRDCNHIVFLDMRGNAIHELHRGVFQDFRSLLFLDLSENSLETLHSGTFAGAQELLDIYLFRNQLTLIHHDAFSGAGNIRGIYLSKNSIPVLPRAALRGLPRLQYFFISRNQLVYITRHMFKENRELTHVGFAYNQLEVIQPETFKHLTKLEYLDLSHNRLLKIEGALFGNLQNLETLKLMNSSINSIPYEILNSPRLEVADLSNNDVTSIEPDWDSPALGALRLTGNPLECDCAFRNLQSAYREVYEGKAGDHEDWFWVTQVNCSNGKPLLNVTIDCGTTPRMVGLKDPQGNAEIHISPDYEEPFPLPLLITVIIISVLCLAICLYVLVIWGRACKQERDYWEQRKTSLPTKEQEVEAV